MVLQAAAALGVASSVCQFIDFTCKVVSETHQIYTQSKSVKRGQIEAVAHTISSLSSDIDTSLQNAAVERALASEETKLKQICEDTIKTGHQLLEILDGVTLAGGNGAWRSLREALRAVWNEEKINSIVQALDRHRADINTFILILLRKRIDEVAGGNQAQSDRLASICTNQADIASQLSSLVVATEAWHADLINTVYREGWRPYDDRKRKNTEDIIKVSRKVGNAAREERTQYLRRKLIARLQFPTIRDRQHRIFRAHSETFRWVYDKDPRNRRYCTALSDWLKAGSGVFWVTGKPASGKSTLMKYVYEHQRTYRLLRRWSRQAERTAICTYFFWRAGHALQKSMTGLLQTLLYDALYQLPELTYHVLADRWENMQLFGDDSRQWSWPELSRAFELLIDVISADDKYRVMFMIDGLDECEGDHLELIRLLQHASSGTSNLRILLASRPEQAFKDAFAQHSSLRMQDLTYPDIVAYIDATLCRQPAFHNLKSHQPEYAAGLVSQIAQKACGVFLWVVLVVASLVTGLNNGDRPSEIEQRLATIPPELDELYSQMWRNLDPLYRQHASQMLQMMKVTQQSLNLLDFSYADEEGSVEHLLSSGTMLTTAEIQQRHDAGGRRLTSRCKGLLEVTARDGSTAPDVLFAQAAHHSRGSDSENEPWETRNLGLDWSSQSSDSEGLHPPKTRQKAQPPPRDGIRQFGRMQQPPQGWEQQLHPTDLPDRFSSSRSLGRNGAVARPAPDRGQVTAGPNGDSSASRSTTERPQLQPTGDADGSSARKRFPLGFNGPHHTTSTGLGLDRIVEPPHHRLLRMEQHGVYGESVGSFQAPENFIPNRSYVPRVFRRLKRKAPPRTSNQEVEDKLPVKDDPAELLPDSRLEALNFKVFEVDYIHRTAKDFLDIPSNWQMILAADGGQFSPQIALLKSSILMLGALPVAELTPSKFWAWIRYCFQCAAEVEACGIVIDDQWLEHIGTAAAMTASRKPNRDGLSFLDHYKSELDDASRPTSQRLGARFTTLCVQYNLTAMIKAMRDRQVPMKPDISCRPVLEYSWLGRSDFRDEVIDGPIATPASDDDEARERTHKSYSRRLVRPEIITTLIKAGADPNEWYANGTPWLRTLTRMYSFYEHRCKDKDWRHSGFQQFYDIFTAFVQGGADPRADWNSPGGSYSRELFGKWDREKLRRLQRLMKSKQRKLPGSATIYSTGASSTTKDSRPGHDEQSAVPTSSTT